MLREIDSCWFTVELFHLPRKTRNKHSVISVDSFSTCFFFFTCGLVISHGLLLFSAIII